jgi:DNA-binding SARP family transcriptional activator/tetratricopeptide (TPR) repeat protein
MTTAKVAEGTQIVSKRTIRPAPELSRHRSSRGSESSGGRYRTVTEVPPPGKSGYRPAVQATVFGGLRVGGLTDAEIGSRKARTLLAVLLLARGAPVRADQLIDVLWRDAPPERPAEQLGVLVSRLRRLHGPDAVQRTGDGYATSLIAVDLTEFEARTADAQARLAAGEVGAALASARAALELADAGPLLGAETGDWLDIERATVARRLATVRLVAATGALAIGDPLAAVGAAEQALDHDPYDELALRVLLRAHVAAGRPASALAAFARFRARLVDDLGVDPGPEVVELYARILRGDERPGPGSDRPATVAGRDDELRRLHRLLHADALEHTVIVSGEPGIGKTALLAAFLAGARGRAVIIAGRCDPLGRDLPLQPLLDGLEVLLRGLGRERAAEVLGADAGVLGPLLGAGFATRPAGANAPVPVPADPGEALGQLFAALLRVVERAGSGGDGAALLIVVDDLHLAGRSTVEWLRFAARRSERLRLVLASRPTPVPVPEGAGRIELGPLDLAAAGRLVEVRIGAPMDVVRIEDLWTRSGGNPLLLHALATAPADATVPAGVREVVDGLLESFGGAAATLRAAAVLGPRLDLDLVAGVLGRSGSAVLDDLDAGVRARLLVERESGLEFGHELFREAAAASVSPIRRRLLHRQAATVLAARTRREPLTIAWHARRGDAPELASTELVAAARLAVRRSDLDAADALLAEALALDPSVHVQLALAEVALRRGDLIQAAQASAAAVDAGAGAAGHELAGWTAYYQRRPAAALRFAERGAATATDADTRARCTALAGRVRHSLGELAAAEAALVESARLASPDLVGMPRVWLASLRAHQGRPDDALAMAEAALVDPSSIRHPFAVGHGHFARWFALGMLGRPATGLAAIEDYLARQHPDHTAARFRPFALNMQAWMLRGVGELGMAAERNAAAAQTVDPAVPAEPEVQGRLDLVDIALLRGEVDRAARLLSRVELQPLDSGTMVWHQRERHGLLTARIALAAGDRAGAAGAATEVCAWAAGRGSIRHELVARLLAACAVAGADSSSDDSAGRAAVADLLTRLDRTSGLEAWRWTALAAQHLGVDRWWALAERQVDVLAGRSGERATTLRGFARRWLDALR